MSNPAPPEPISPRLHNHNGTVLVIAPGSAPVRVSEAEACRRILAHEALVAAAEAVLAAPIVAEPHPCWQMLRAALRTGQGVAP